MEITTTLPAPTTDAFTPAGQWPHMPALRRELTALVADLPAVQTTPGEGARQSAEDLFNRGFRRLAVGVYAPLGRDEAWLGWYQRDRLREVEDRVIDYLPGARRATELSSERSALRILWGSNEPGWSLTAVWVRRSFDGLWREPGGLWTADQCAEHCGIGVSTWRSYLARRDAGVPISLGEAVLPGRSRAVAVWDRERVIKWHEARPGKGGRPARVEGEARP
jgi:hypothetical protein